MGPGFHVQHCPGPGAPQGVAQRGKTEVRSCSLNLWPSGVVSSSSHCPASSAGSLLSSASAPPPPSSPRLLFLNNCPEPRRHKAPQQKRQKCHPPECGLKCFPVKKLSLCVFQRHTQFPSTASAVRLAGTSASSPRIPGLDVGRTFPVASPFLVYGSTGETRSFGSAPPS